MPKQETPEEKPEFKGFRGVAEHFAELMKNTARAEGEMIGGDHIFGEHISVRHEDGERGASFVILNPAIEDTVEAKVKAFDEFEPRPANQCRCNVDGRDCCGQPIWGEAEIITHDLFTIVFQQWRLCV